MSGGGDRTRTCIAFRPAVFKTAALPLCDPSALGKQYNPSPGFAKRTAEDGYSVISFTLKALANFSPGFALKPWVEKLSIDSRNSEGVARICGSRTATQLLQSCVCDTESMFPGLPKRNPGLELANAFSVKFKLYQYR